QHNFDNAIMDNDKEHNNRVIDIHSYNEWNKVLSYNSLVVVYWWSSRLTFNLDWDRNTIWKIYEDLSVNYPNYIFAKVDIDEIDDLSKSHKVEKTPTFDCFCNYKHLLRIVGSRLTRIKTFLSNYDDSYINNISTDNKSTNNIFIRVNIDESDELQDELQ